MQSRNKFATFSKFKICFVLKVETKIFVSKREFFPETTTNLVSDNSYFQSLKKGALDFTVRVPVSYIPVGLEINKNASINK